MTPDINIHKLSKNVGMFKFVPPGVTVKVLLCHLQCQVTWLSVDILIC